MPSETPQKIKPYRMMVIRQLQLLSAPQHMEEELLSGNPKSHHHIFEPISQFTHYDTSLEGNKVDIAEGDCAPHIHAATKEKKRKHSSTHNAPMLETGSKKIQIWQ